MPWQEVSTLKLRKDFVVLASAAGANMSELCKRFGISRPTGYKWLERFRKQGEEGLGDRSRRPHSCPNRTPEPVEKRIEEIYKQYKKHQWGARKVWGCLRNEGYETLPAVSTVHAILARRACLPERTPGYHPPYTRFEYPAPNELWQLDFTGHFAMEQGRCHPLPVLDDHSRFAVGLFACGNETTATVRSHLTTLFRQWGLPKRMLGDNGCPWGHPRAQAHSQLSVWLMRLGIVVLHGRAYHPQTQGKVERFHRTLRAELLSGRTWRDLAHTQAHFDDYRCVYNHQRPHNALDLAVPASRYDMSPRPFPETLAPIEYGPDDVVRKVCDKGQFSFNGRRHRIGKAFRGEPVALRPSYEDGVYHVYYCSSRIAGIDLNKSQKA